MAKTEQSLFDDVADDEEREERDIYACSGSASRMISAVATVPDFPFKSTLNSNVAVVATTFSFTTSF